MWLWWNGLYTLFGWLFFLSFWFLRFFRLTFLIHHLFLYQLFITILLMSLLFVKLPHNLNIELLKLSGPFLSSTGLLVVFVAVHDHFINVSLKLCHMFILVSSNLVLNSFEVNRFEDDIKIIRNL